ncbi:hypothetical protein EXIGLDRAFT_771268 [Exidia glandulosa HHB12029]|uniref:EthD domain-containing protein n=1 Tax=Exidia glandulosa HHB12029 TaxID=1314781 RepID=A0A165G4U3_EXIGL|nr:hypothetical protein EXIGLDRAFT_771268 [Exidia glandulosa HHB12029]
MVPLVKFAIFLKRKEGLSVEAFNKQYAPSSSSHSNFSWSESHAALFKRIPIAQKNLVKYVQYHINAEASAIIGTVMPIVSFDGAAIFYARSQEELLAVFRHPEYLSVVVPDEESFIDRPASQVMVGYEEVKLESVQV